VGAGRPPRQAGAPVNPPVVLSSTFRADGPLSYSREGNPTWAAFEEVVGLLEGGRALAFASGMAAIAAVVETLPAGAAVVAPADAYSGTRRLLADLASRGRLRLHLVDVTEVKLVAEAADGAALVWLESPTNPLMRVPDLAATCQAAHERGALVAVDNTFATPLLQKPLDLGADVSVHSATKLLAGHSEVLMGVTVCRQEDLLDRLRTRRSLHGAVPGPMEAFMALQGLRTLALRMERAQSSAGELARRLESHPVVSEVLYPGLAGHPDHDLCRRQMSGFGTMVSFVVAGGAVAADAVCGAVQVCTPATSLGGVETLIERRGRWEGEEHLPPGLLRLSVGIEHVEDLWDDLARALEAAHRPG